jgi:hypothetical protein
MKKCKRCFKILFILTILYKIKFLFHSVALQSKKLCVGKFCLKDCQANLRSNPTNHISYQNLILEYSDEIPRHCFFEIPRPNHLVFVSLVSLNSTSYAQLFWDFSDMRDEMDTKSRYLEDKTNHWAAIQKPIPYDGEINKLN